MSGTSVPTGQMAMIAYRLACRLARTVFRTCDSA